MANTLGLYGDMDDIDVIRDVEGAFAVAFSEEPESWYTVGDIHADLLARLAGSGETSGFCATARAFYRIRRCLAGAAGARTLRSDTPVMGPGDRQAKHVMRRLQEGTGLRMPFSRGTWMSDLGVYGVIVGFFATLIAPMAGVAIWMPLLVVGVSAALLWLDPNVLPADCRTVGQLARKAAALNRGRLIAEGAAARIDSIWDDLVEVLSEHTTLPKTEIRADTWLLQSQADRSRAD